MPENYDSLVDTNPFWFVSSEVLTRVFRAEINVIAQLFSAYPALRKFLDTPQATIQQRTISFKLLVHRRIIEVIDDTIAARYEKNLTFNEYESHAVSESANLVTSDAPAWVLEMNEVAAWFPTRLHAALPEGLRDHVLCAIDPKKRAAAFLLAEETFGTIEQVQSLIARVFDEQLQRLSERWPVTTSPVHSESHFDRSNRRPAAQRIVRRKLNRTSDKLRIVRDRLIYEIDDISQTMTEFLRLMDARKVKPQPTWEWPGSWARAYQDPHLRKLIHQDKSRAISRARRNKLLFSLRSLSEEK
jgi:hypothetical protein